MVIAEAADPFALAKAKEFFTSLSLAGVKA